MAHETPQFNVKTGSDSQLFFSREVTSGDISVGNNTKEELGLIKANVVQTDGNDVFEYPQLTRRTGHSIKGTTESIESSELRKGRTKSAPRKGNSSSEGSLDIELSPETYDDIFEATFRNKFKAWESDNEDAFVNPDGIACDPGEFVTHTKNENNDVQEAVYSKVKMLTQDDSGMFTVDDPEAYEISQLTVGTEDIKYSALAQYGGITGEDLYQEFQHLAVNTMDLSVSPGQIVTGSFGFMGANNPKLVQEGDDKVYSEPKKVASEEIFNTGVYYTRSGTGTEGDPYSYAKATTYDADTDYCYAIPTGLVGELAKTNKQKGRFLDHKDPAAVKAWIGTLADKVATTTDQFTAREGFLYVNGRRVQYGSNLTFNLNNGLKQLFAIFEKGAISTAPMSLDITGTLDAYLITNYAEFLYNYGIDDKDVELVFCFQDQEDDPNYMYVVQIFKAKFDTDISQGAEELTISLPFTSFGERAARIFRLKKKNIEATLDNTEKEVTVVLNSKPEKADGLNVTLTLTDGTSIELTEKTPYDAESGEVVYSYDDAIEAGKVTIATVKFDGKTFKKGFNI